MLFSMKGALMVCGQQAWCTLNLLLHCGTLVGSDREQSNGVHIGFVLTLRLWCPQTGCRVRVCVAVPDALISASHSLSHSTPGWQGRSYHYLIPQTTHPFNPKGTRVATEQTFNITHQGNCSSLHLLIFKEKTFKEL